MIGVSPPAPPAGRSVRGGSDGRLATTGVVVALVSGSVLVALSVFHPVEAAGAAVAVGLILVVVAHPPVATYVMLGLTPIVVGVERGMGTGPLRLNEVLLGVVLVGLGLRWLWEVLHGAGLRFRPTRVDVAMAVLTVAASILPLLWLYGRSGSLAVDDLQYAAVMVKYLLLYGVVRVTIRTPRQVFVALGTILAAATVVAAVAIVQTLAPFDLPGWFSEYYAPAGQERLLETGRGTSTLASSIAVGDHLAFALAVALAWLLKGLPGRGPMIAITGLLTAGVIASGQFSAIIALVVAVGALGWVTGHLRRLARAAAPLVMLGGAAAWPVLARRLEGFSSPSGVPTSWSDRLENLRTHFWPELADGGLWLGVRPEARVAAPEAWRDWIWIESGHTWLLWTGGLPLLAAYLWFAWTAFTTTARRARLSGPVGVAAASAFTATAVVFVLMALDPHLTMRGSADLAFPLLGLALVTAPPSRPRSPHAHPDR